MRRKSMHRRDVLKLGTMAGLSAAFGTAASRPACAEAWPDKNVRVIVPYAAGSATDLIPRTIFDALGARVGHTFVVENRLGGGTTVGANAVARAEPDGYTVLVHSNAIVTVPAIQANVPYDPVRDFSAITPLGNVPLVLVTAPEKKIDTVQELVALAKAKPGSINYAAAGIGTPPHLTAERFRLAAGFQGHLVPFKGAPEALTEVLTGRVDFYFCPLPAAIGFIKDGKLKPLAIGGSKRALALPDVPTTVEAGFANSDFDFWVGAFVPKATPRELVAEIHRQMVAAIQSASVNERLSKLGVEPMIMSPEDFDARIAREAGIAAQLAKAANIAVQ
jgi:tripartite-type tricarboxylate transporter receptor subunit TctC